MKTRRKIVKSPKTGGRRSSIICVKKSPLPRKNARKNIRVLSKNKPRLQTYESPLKSLHFNGPSNSSTSTNSLAVLKSTNSPSTSKDAIITSPSIKQEVTTRNFKHEEDSFANTIEMPLISPLTSKKIKSIKEDTDSENEKDENIEEDNLSVMSLHSNNSTKSKNSKKRSIMSIIAAGDIPTKRKRKLKKSPLSRINESTNSETHTNSLSDSIIIVDDDSKPGAPIKCSTSSTSKLLSDSDTKSKTIRSMTKSEDIVIIDCNDSLLTEMEEFHEAMNVTEKVQQKNPKFSDSIIIIDHDEDLPAQPQPITSKLTTSKRTTSKPTVSKPIEDCFVVWSSLPQPSTSNQNVQTPLSNRPPLNSNADLLKCDKIMLDTGGNFSNLRLLDNDNIQGVKSTVTKASRRAMLTSNLLGSGTEKKAKTLTKSKPTKTEKKTVTKTATKTTTKSVVTKRSTKSNGETIFAAKTEDNKTATTKKRKGSLREIVIDGCNVAMAYTNNKTFDEKGIKMCIDYFTKRGHSVKVFVPQHKRAVRHPMLEKWHNEGIVVFTPSRKLGNKNFTPYDDRYIVGYATACKGIVVSQDQFRDLYNEKPEYRDTIENRLLVPTFVGDYVMFPEDPLGRNGPALKDFLKH